MIMNEEKTNCPNNTPQKLITSVLNGKHSSVKSVMHTTDTIRKRFCPNEIVAITERKFRKKKRIILDTNPFFFSASKRNSVAEAKATFAPANMNTQNIATNRMIDRAISAYFIGVNRSASYREAPFLHPHKTQYY